jgi:hypothetical protein
MPIRDVMNIGGFKKVRKKNINIFFENMLMRIAQNVTFSRVFRIPLPLPDSCTKVMNRKFL